MSPSEASTSRPAGEEPKAGDAALEHAEREFVACMDSIQEYMRLQSKLQEQLKQGLLSLTRAKYSMGPIGQAQYDNDMVASVRITASPVANGGTATTAAGQEGVQARTAETSGAGTSAARGDSNGPARFRTFALVKVAPQAGAGTGANSSAAATAAGADADGRQGPGGSQPGGGGGGAGPTSTAVAGGGAAGGGSDGGKAPGGSFHVDLSSDNDDDQQEEEEDEGLREANEFLRRMRLELEGAAGGAGADAGQGSGNSGGGKAGGAATGGIGGGAAAAPGRRRGKRGGAGGGAGHKAGDPLHWFGVLVPPALKEAQAQFAEVLQTCIQLSNTAQRLQAHAVAC